VKIAHVTPAFHPAHVYGGPTYTTYRLCQALAAEGNEVRVLTTDANGRDRTLDVVRDREIELDEGLLVRYCHRIAVHSVAPRLLSWLPALVAWADVVHLTAVYNFTTFPALLACRRAKKPLVWSPRGGFQRWEGTTSTRAKGAWESLCRVAAPERLVLHVTSTEEAHQSRSRLPGAITAVIPNGIDAPPLAKRSSSSGMRLLSVGRLHPIKGFDNLIEACAKIGIPAGFDWTLAIAGDGERAYAETLRNRVRELGMDRFIRFVGDVRGDEKERLFQNADVVVVPSHSENFGVVVVEALARGLPVIAGRGTPWSLLEEKGCGLWVANDPDSLAHAICRMAALPWGEMGQRGRQLVETSYSWPHVAKMTIKLYSSMTSRQTSDASVVNGAD
jgi:glycosyltransferase involved in cell wall biosynthesis